MKSPLSKISTELGCIFTALCLVPSHPPPPLLAFIQQCHWLDFFISSTDRSHLLGNSSHILSDLEFLLRSDMKILFLSTLILFSSVSVSAIEKFDFFTWPGDVVARTTLFTQLSVSDVSHLEQRCMNMALTAEQRLVSYLQSQATLYRYAYGATRIRTSRRPQNKFNTECSFYALKSQSGAPDIDFDHSYSSYKNLSTLAEAQQICERQKTLLFQQRDVLSVSSASFNTLFEGNVCSLGIVRVKRD